MSPVASRLRSAFPIGPGLLLLCVACVVMGGLLAPALGAGALALDEHVSYWMLDSEHPGTVQSRCLEYGAVPPLGSWLQAASVRLFGKSEWALRLPSLVAAWLSLVVVFITARHLPPSNADDGTLRGGVAACLLACHPDLLDEVRIGRCYGLVLLVATLVLLATLRWREKLCSFPRSLAWTLSASALIWTHYTAALLVAVSWSFLAVAVVYSGIRSKAGRNLAISSLLLGILCLPLWPAVVRLREWGPFLNMLAPEASVWQTISSFWWLGLPLGGLAALVAGALLVRNSRPAGPKWMERDWLLLGCSLFPLGVIAFIAVDDLSSLANPRYRVAYAPAGALWMAQWLTRTGSWKPAVIGLLVALGAAWSVQPLRPWQLGRLGSPADTSWRELSELIATQGQPGEPIFVQSGLVESSLVPGYFTDPVFMEYVACRVSKFYLPAAYPRQGLPYFWDEATLRHFENDLRSQSPPALWIACATDTDLNRGSLTGMQQLVEKLGYRIGSQVNWPHATLLRMTQ